MRAMASTARIGRKQPASLQLLGAVAALLVVSHTAGAQERLFSMAERQLCAQTCQKQLGCAGQAQARDLLAGCMGACEQALRIPDVATFRPWWAAASCLGHTCGTPYNECLLRGMAAATIAEQKCVANCGKRVGCNPSATAQDNAACLTECVAKLTVGADDERAFEESSFQCSNQACGLPVDICLTKLRGGPTGDCAALCENQFRCGAAATDAAYGTCMQGCVPVAMDPARRADMAAALKCAGLCGAAQVACTAKARGGTPLFCFTACEKQLGCGGAGGDDAALVQCAGTCESVMAGADPAQKVGFIAVDRCKTMACGPAYNTCVMAALGVPTTPAPTYAQTPPPTYTQPPQPTYTQPPQPTYTQPAQPVQPPQPTYTQPAQPVQPTYPQPAQPAQPVQPTYTQVPTTPPPVTPVTPPPVTAPPVVVKRDPARDKCQAACEKLERCHVGACAADCVDACLSDPVRRPAMLAVSTCSGQACGDGFDACILGKLGLTARQKECVPSCTQTLACQTGNKPSPLDVGQCAQACTKTKEEVAAAKRCLTASCQDLDACIEKAEQKPPTKEELRCQSICLRSAECAGLPPDADATCYDRCLGDSSAKNEFRLREKCIGQACSPPTVAGGPSGFDRCILAGMGVTGEKFACEHACRRELTCAAAGQAPALPALAACMKGCSRPANELQAIAACAELPCNSTGYDTCIEFKRKALATAAVVPVKVDPQLTRCKTLCEKVDSCSPGDGGESCTARCATPAAAAEFKARDACNGASCEQYDTCLVTKLGVPKAKAVCANACQHELTCRPPGEPRDVNALVACTKACTKSTKDLAAELTCEPRGCGVAFERCVAEKTGRLAEIKSVQGQCESLCGASEKCVAKTGGEGCIKRCVEAGGQSPEAKARVSCAQVGCEKYDQCVLDTLGAKAEGRRCIDACRWDLGCERGNQAHDYSRLVQCVSDCRMSDVELAARSDCQLYGCGSGFRECVQKRLTAAGAGVPGPATPKTPQH